MALKQVTTMAQSHTGRTTHPSHKHHKHKSSKVACASHPAARTSPVQANTCPNHHPSWGCWATADPKEPDRSQLEQHRDTYKLALARRGLTSLRRGRLAAARVLVALARAATVRKQLAISLAHIIIQQAAVTSVDGQERAQATPLLRVARICSIAASHHTVTCTGTITIQVGLPCF